MLYYGYYGRGTGPVCQSFEVVDYIDLFRRCP